MMNPKENLSNPSSIENSSIKNSGMENSCQKLMQEETDYVLKNYARYPIVLERGEGVFLYDTEGKEYLDFLCGISVSILGHRHPRIISALEEQAKKIIHSSNLYYNPNSIRLAQKVSEISFPGKTFFCNSGTEANETAIKLARLYGNQNDKPKIITLKNSFHGRTMGSLSLTGQSKYQQNFGPLLSNIIHIERNNESELKREMDDSVSALFLETVQGEGGIHPLEKSFVQKARELCTHYKALLICDEIQSGMGRTGRFFDYQHYSIEPDAFTLAKGLANGIPIGLIHIQNSPAKLFIQGSHGSTFGGNPLATRVALEVLSVIQESLLEQILVQGRFLYETLLQLKDSYSQIIEIRGRGLMWALELEGIDAKDLLDACHREGLLINAIGTNIIRLLPPFIITEKEIRLFETKIKKAFSHLLTQKRN